MADRKITDLTALAAGSQATGDLLTIVDVSEGAAADKNKKITVESLFKGIPSNVGIGTSSPTTKLEINGGTDNNIVRIVSTDANANIEFADNTTTSGCQIGANGDNLKFGISGTEKMRIDSSGRLLIGTTSARSKFFNNSSLYSGKLQVEGNTESTRIISLVHNTSNSNFPILVLGKSRGTSAGSHTVVQSGDGLGSLSFQGADGSELVEAASIKSEIDATPGANDMPGRLVFSTCADGASSATERMRIDSKGRALINSTAAATDNSFLTVQNSSGACEVNIMSGPTAASVINLGDTGDYNIGRIKYDQSGNSLQFNTNNSEAVRINSSRQVLIGQTSATSILGNGVAIKSNAVGSKFNEGALSLTGTGGDFYGLTFSKNGSNTAEGFGFLSVFSSATDSLQIGYNTGSSNVGILTCYANGNVFVGGALSKGSGSFRIDHPLPAKTETHDLVHSFIEGPQADLIYRGKVDLVAGAATVNLDTAARMTEGTFVLLNTNVQCFTSNESDWTAVRGSVSGNTLTIAAEDSTSTATVSWLVIGERQDQHMIDTDWTDDNGRVITEPEKPS